MKSAVRMSEKLNQSFHYKIYMTVYSDQKLITMEYNTKTNGVLLVSIFYEFASTAYNYQGN